jgi:hypothetical protein
MAGTLRADPERIARQCFDLQDQNFQKLAVDDPRRESCAVSGAYRPIGHEGGTGYGCQDLLRNR